MTRRALLVVGLLGLCVALLGPLTAAAGEGRHTSTRTVSPIGTNGELNAGYKVIRHEGHAVCQTGSFMTGRADRCSTPTSQTVVLDPCWPTADSKTFICQRRPWRREVIELHVPKPASDGPGVHRQSLPWGMRIGAKVRCLLDPGSVRKLSGHALLYHCTHHRDVFGPLRRPGTHWKAHVYRTGARTRSGYRSLGWKPVRIAWYGAAPQPAASPTPTPTLLPTLTPTASPTASESATSMS